jgi:hypothetical protein
MVLGFLIYKKFVNIILANHDKVAVVTVFIKCHGGDPRINIQNNKGSAKPYQVKQVLITLNKLEIYKNETTK